MPIILTTLEVEMEMIVVWGQLGQKLVRPHPQSIKPGVVVHIYGPGYARGHRWEDCGTGLALSKYMWLTWKITKAEWMRGR
jgi:hypothetical protein